MKFMNVNIKNWVGVALGIWVTIYVVSNYDWLLKLRNGSLDKQSTVLSSDGNLRLSNTERKSLKESDQVKISSSYRCEPLVHVAMACYLGKNTCSRLMIPTLMSLLIHRRQPLYLHLIVDTTCEVELRNLLEHWILPDVKYTYYDIDDYLDDIPWTSNLNNCGVYSFVKLLIPKMLTEDVDKMIVLNSGLTILCNIGELWEMFTNMTDKQFIGLVEHQSDWYLRGKRRWPVFGSGYNTGVMLLDLNKMRRHTDWDALWRRTVNENLELQRAIIYSEQDVLNAIIKRDPKIVYKIPCVYNIQMPIAPSENKCCGIDGRHDVKIVYWDALPPSNKSITRAKSQFFRNIYTRYMTLDGSLFKDELSTCPGIDKEEV